MLSRDNPALHRYPEANKAVGHLICRKLYSTIVFATPHAHCYIRTSLHILLLSLALPMARKRKAKAVPMSRQDFFKNHPTPSPPEENQPAGTDIDDTSEFPSLGGNAQAQQQNASFAPGVSPWRATRSPGPERPRYVGGIGRGRVSLPPVELCGTLSKHISSI